MIEHVTTPSHAQLFLIKNLMCLKTLLISYEIYPTRHTENFDFSHIWTTFSELFARGDLLNPRAYYNLLNSGVLYPRVVENDTDARLEIDGLLRDRITMFTEHWAKQLSAAKGMDVPRRNTIDELKELLRKYFPHDLKIREALVAATKELVDSGHSSK
jgi:hypothetical protein